MHGTTYIISFDPTNVQHSCTSSSFSCENPHVAHSFMPIFEVIN
jgi:hypothetical protein